MIFTYILNGLQGVILWIVNLLPNVTFTMPSVDGLASSVGIISYILTPTVFYMLVGSLVFWLAAQPTASLIKFIYKKIPGVS